MDLENNELAPTRVIKNGAGPAWLLYLAIFIFAAVLGAGLWYLLAPESLARLAGRWSSAPLTIQSLSVTIDRQTIELPPNGTIEVHPGQKFHLAGLNSSRWLNYDLILTSPDFDVTLVTDDVAASPKTLLPNETFERPRELRLEVKDGEETVAVFTILSRFTALDFSARGDAAEDPAEKADNYQKALALDPGSTVVRDKLVAALVAADQKERAAELLEEELARLGPDETLLTRLLTLYTDLRQVPKQAEVLKRLIELADSRGRSSIPYKQSLAGVFKESGWPAQAAEIYEALLDGAPPAQVSAYLRELVALYRESRQTDLEISTLKKLLEVSPPDQATGIWSEIVTLYENSTGDGEGRLAAWRALADLLPEGRNKVNAHKMIARLLVSEEKYDEARAAYQAALKLAPDDLNILLNLARLSAASGDRAAYLRHLTKAVELAPKNLEYRKELAEALREDGQNAKAKVQYQALLDQAPDDLETRLIFIEFLEKTGDNNGLIKQYGELMERHPQDKVIAYNYGALQFEKKDWNKAIEAFKKVLEIDPADVEARNYLLVAYQRKGQRKEILEQALALYQRDPSQAVYRTLMFNTQENAKDWEGFAQVAREVTKAEPDSPYGWQQLARAQTQLNKKEDAAESLWKVAERTKEKQVEAWMRAAQALAAAKKPDRAYEAYKKVVEIEPANERASKAIMEYDLERAKKQAQG